MTTVEDDRLNNLEAPYTMARIEMEEQHDANTRNNNPSTAVSTRQKALVLLGSAVLQLPIWGDLQYLHALVLGPKADH